MELKFIQARTLPRLQEVLNVLCSRLVLIPIFHPPMYDGTNWVITWYAPIQKDELVAEAFENGPTT